MPLPSPIVTTYKVTYPPRETQNARIGVTSSNRIRIRFCETMNCLTKLTDYRFVITCKLRKMEKNELVTCKLVTNRAIALATARFKMQSQTILINNIQINTFLSIRIKFFISTCPLFQLRVKLYSLL